MEMSWQSEASRLACRWSVEASDGKYIPPWIGNASFSSQSKPWPPAVPDFATLSPFLSRRWYGPNCPDDGGARLNSD